MHNACIGFLFPLSAPIKRSYSKRPHNTRIMRSYHLPVSKVPRVNPSPLLPGVELRQCQQMCQFPCRYKILHPPPPAKSERKKRSARRSRASCNRLSDAGSFFLDREKRGVLSTSILKGVNSSRISHMTNGGEKVKATPRVPMRFEKGLTYCRKLIRNQIKKFEEELEKLGSEIRHHEDNLQFLKAQCNNVDSSVKDLEGDLDIYQTSQEAETHDQNPEIMHSVQKTMDPILSQNKISPSILCKSNDFQIADFTLSKDILGIVANLGKVADDILSRLLSEYLGVEAMLAIVCKTYKGIKALEKYGTKGKLDALSAVHGLETTIRKPIHGRLLGICLESLKPYVGKLVAKDPQKKLDLPKPILPNGKHPPGFLGYAVNMISMDATHLTYITSSGYGLRETLFYSLFSHLQVYVSRMDMELALPCITNGAISLDGGLIKGLGVFSLGETEDAAVRFASSLHLSSLPHNIAETEEHLRLMLRRKQSIEDDIEREINVMENVKSMFNKKKEDFFNFLSERNPSSAKVLTGNSAKVKVYYRFADDEYWKCRMILRNISFKDFSELMRQRKGCVETDMVFQYSYSANQVGNEKMLSCITNDDGIRSMLSGGDVYLLVSIVKDQKAIQRCLPPNSGDVCRHGHRQEDENIVPNTTILKYVPRAAKKTKSTVKRMDSTLGLI